MQPRAAGFKGALACTAAGRHAALLPAAFGWHSASQRATAQCWREKLEVLLMPRASAAVRSHSDDRSLWPSTAEQGSGVRGRQGMWAARRGYGRPWLTTRRCPANWARCNRLAVCGTSARGHASPGAAGAVEWKDEAGWEVRRRTPCCARGACPAACLCACFIPSKVPWCQPSPRTSCHRRSGSPLRAWRCCSWVRRMPRWRPPPLPRSASSWRPPAGGWGWRWVGRQARQHAPQVMQRGGCWALAPAVLPPPSLRAPCPAPAQTGQTQSSWRPWA